MRVVFVICEGAHDIAFLKHILKQLCGFKPYEGTLASLPVPLAKMLINRLSGTKYDDSLITSLPKPIMPDQIFLKENNLYLLINGGGNTRTEEVIAFVEAFKDVFDVNTERKMTKIKSYDLFFLTDADSKEASNRGFENVLKYLKNKYSQLAKGNIDKLEHGEWYDTKGLPRRLGCFIFTNAQGQEGTLEDVILPMIRQNREPLIDGAEQYITDHAKEKDKVFKVGSDRHKAVLTIVGQLNKPGRPLSAILADNKEWFPRQLLEINSSSTALARLFNEMPIVETQSV